MELALKDFINQYVQLPEADMADVLNRFACTKVKKNEYLLQEGKVCTDLAFVKEGCLRLFYMDGDVEISVWFAFKNSSAIDIYSFISQEPSKYYLQAIEDSEVLCLPKADLLKLYESVPRMQEMMRRFWEDAVLNLIDRFTSLQRDTAEQRYLNLLAKPPYMQKIPQKYLASFIGVTPTSLSRIRKGIQ